MASSKRQQLDTILLMCSRIARSFAAGFLAVVVGLYYLHTLNLPELLIGILFGVGAFFTPIMSFLLGRYADKYGRKKILLIALTFLPVAVLILIYSTFFPLLLVSAALGGFGIAGGLVGGGAGAIAGPIQRALLAEKTTYLNRTRVFSIFQMLSSLAGSAGALLSHINDYKELFYVALIIAIISIVMVLPIKESFRPSKNIVDRPRLGPKDGSVIKRFTVIGAFDGSAQGFFVPFLSIIFSTYFHASNGQIGNIFALGGIMSALSITFTPYLTGKLGFVKFIITTRAVAAISTLLIPLSSVLLIGSIFYFALTCSRVMAQPAQSSFLMSLVSEGSRATATGSNQSARLAPGALSSVLSGYMLDTLSLAVPFVSSFLFAVSNLYLYHRFFGKTGDSKH